MSEQIYSELESILGQKKVSIDVADRIFFTFDPSHPSPPPGMPSVVVMPRSTEEVSEVLKIANKYKTPVSVWGRGTTFAGTGVRKNSILIDLSAMDNFIEIDEESLTVTVDAGVVWLALVKVLEKKGWELPMQWHGGIISSTMGGAVAAGTITRTTEHGGRLGENITGLEVVLPTGKVIRTGSWVNQKAKPFERYCLGPDLTGLFINSCGALGVITKVGYAIRKRRTKLRYLNFAFNDYNDAYKAVYNMQVQETARYLMVIQGDLPIETGALLHIVLADNDESNLDKKEHDARVICRAYNGEEYIGEHTKNFWESIIYSWLRGRDPRSYYFRGKGTPVFCPEVTVIAPILKFPELTKYFWDYWNGNQEEIARHGGILKGFDIFVNRNTGVVWVDTLFPLLDPDAWKFGNKLRSELFKKYWEMGAVPYTLGGIIGNILKDELKDYLEIIRAIKRVFDPNNILSPGVLGL